MSDDPLIKVTIHMRASLHHALRDHAQRNGSSVSELCRDSARSELDGREHNGFTDQSSGKVA